MLNTNVKCKCLIQTFNTIVQSKPLLQTLNIKMFHINVIIHVYGGEETGNGCGSSWVNDKNVIKCDGTGMGFKDCFNLRET
jgi:hypothetical protein